MRVGELRAEVREGAVEHSAEVRWEHPGPRKRDSRLWFSVPQALSAEPGDGSPFLSACLLQAMRGGEDLEVDAPVSARLLAATERIQTIYMSWAPTLRRAEVSVAGETAVRPRRGDMGCLLSRGVDSMFSAAAEARETVTHLVFIADLDPINDEETRAEEVRLAGEVAALVDRPLVVVGTNLRRVADRLLDWSDLFGGGLSAVAQCLDGGLGGMLIPSSADWATLGPAGSSPALDPLYSTETMEIDHGSLDETRDEKVAWLAANRPDLLPLLKVCFRENRPDNCGRCRKCLWTMASLEGTGSLARASSFPPEIDLDRLRGVRPRQLYARISWLQTAQALEQAGAAPEVSGAIREALRRCLRPPLRERLPPRYARLLGVPVDERPPGAPPILFRTHQTDTARAMLRGPIDGARV